MVFSKNFEILISILVALRSVPGAGGALTTASPGDLATVTIYDTPGYSIAIGCVRECLMQEIEPGVPDGLIIAAALGCTSPYYNGCYCTSAVASEVTSLLSRCIVAACTGTAEIPVAFSIYNSYCTTAGYPGPATNIAESTTAAQNGGQTSQSTTAAQNGGQTSQSTTAAQSGGQTSQSSTALVTSAAVSTVTNGDSTFMITETAVQTVLTTPTSFPSSSGGGGSKVNTGAIVGGVLGALLLITVLLSVFLVWLPRRQKKKAAAESQLQPGPFVPTQPKTQGAEGSTFVPTVVPVRKGGGRAELPEKGGAGIGEKEVEVDGTGLVVRELGEEGRHGLRPEELDSEGRYVGELHGDGRQYGGIELEGREVR